MIPWGRSRSEDQLSRKVAIVAGRTGSYEFATPDTADETRTVGTLTYDSSDALRRACFILARQVPADGLVEVLDALWRINEFHARPRPRLIQGPAHVEATPSIRLGSVHRRPKVWLSED